MGDNDAFLNKRSGNFNATSKEWMLNADQWIQTYYQFRDGKLYFVENDNKEQTCNEELVDTAAFVRQYAGTSQSPYAEIVAFLQTRGA